MAKTSIPAVGYARRSTDLQERSIPDQKAYVEKWATEHGYRLVRWYVDDAISGTSARGRDAFGQMIAAAENGPDFETILCYDISRFSRGGTNETGFYLHRLKLAGVDVVFTADGIPEGDEGELIQGVKSWQARQYSVKLARDTIRGLISNIYQRHSAPGGQPPYGFDKQHLAADGTVLRTLRWLADDSKLEFDANGKLVRAIARNVYVAKAKGDIVRLAPSTPDRVKAIQQIFDLCVQGYGFKSIAERLNRRGIPSMRGAKWNMSNIAQMLRNPVYCGSLVYNKRTSGSLFGMDPQGNLRPKQGKRGNFLNATADWIVVEDVHEPLVSKHVFRAAQEAMAKRRGAGGKARSVKRTLCSTLLVCRRCGSSFTTVRDRRRPSEFGPPYRHYTCAGYHRYGKDVCGLVRIPGPELDAFVLGAIRQALLGDAASTKRAVDAFADAVSNVAASTVGEQRDQRELEQLNRRIKATVGMIADPTFDGLDDLRAVLADLKKKRDALLAATTAASAPTTPAFTKKQLREWAHEQFARLDQLASRTEVDLADRQLVEAFVQRIEIEPDKNTGTIFLFADLQAAFASTRVVGGDDPQTDESANSPSQCLRRERTLAGAILGLAGPGKKIAGVMPCTVIRPGDMADRILDRIKHPQWQGERTKMVYAFPTNDTLWSQYAELRAEGLRAGRGLADATAFYGAHRAAMDAGAVVAWPERFNHDELSAIQHAMNLRLQDEAAFFAEYQNEPLPDEPTADDDLSADDIAEKTNGLDRGTVPLGCGQVTAFVDVQQSLLFYVVVAWQDDFTGYVLDYGAFPEQRRPHFTLREAQPTLGDVAPGAGLEASIYAGLEKLVGTLVAREWRRDDGAGLRIGRLLIDANWGLSTDVVYQFCRQSTHGALLLPSHGKFVGASSIPFSEYRKQIGDQVGHNWRIPNTRGKRAVRYVLYDTNYWKSFVYARLAVQMGDRGCLSLFGRRPADHRLLADHLTAEYRVRTEGRGRTVDEWKLRPAKPDNHWFDCLVGCAVAGSIQGAMLLEMSSPRPKGPRRRLKLSELKSRKH